MREILPLPKIEQRPLDEMPVHFPMPPESFSLSPVAPKTCKVAFIGNTHVGKTTIIESWFPSDSYRRRPTVGANHRSRTVRLEDQDVELAVWDTAGQEQFRAFVPMYIRSAAVVIVTAAVDDLASFTAIDDWIDDVRSACQPMPRLILDRKSTRLNSSHS
jgi:small GTP-binding protein